MVHARRSKSSEAVAIRPDKLQFIRARPRIRVGKTARQAIRLGASARNRGLIAETARRTRRGIADHRRGIGRRRSDRRAVVRENERIDADAHEPEAARVIHGGALNEVRSIRIAHIDFELAGRVAPIARSRIAVVAIFADVDGIVAA